MAKTAFEHFDDLPWPYSHLAKQNTVVQRGEPGKRYRTLSGALAGSFVFSETPEGEAYWLQIAMNLIDGEPVSPPKPGRLLLRLLWPFIVCLVLAGLFLALAGCSSAAPQRWVLSTRSEIYSIDQKRGVATIYTPCAVPAPDCPGRLENIPLAEIDFPYVGKKLKIQ